MKSAALGRRISRVEVTNVSPHGFWLFIGEQERFVSFAQFPWFKEASIRELSHVELPSAHHLYWPDLDIDLAVDSLTHPERYPLVSQARRDKGRKKTPPGKEKAGKSNSPLKTPSRLKLAR